MHLTTADENRKLNGWKQKTERMKTWYLTYERF